MSPDTEGETVTGPRTFRLSAIARSGSNPEFALPFTRENAHRHGVRGGLTTWIENDPHELARRQLEGRLRKIADEKWPLPRGAKHRVDARTGRLEPPLLRARAYRVFRLRMQDAALKGGRPR